MTDKTSQAIHIACASLVAAPLERLGELAAALERAGSAYTLQDYTRALRVVAAQWMQLQDEMNILVNEEDLLEYAAAARRVRQAREDGG